MTLAEMSRAEKVYRRLPTRLQALQAYGLCGNSPSLWSQQMQSGLWDLYGRSKVGKDEDVFHVKGDFSICC